MACALLAAVVGTVLISIFVLLPLNLFLQKVPKMIVEAYPKELVVNIQNGEASINQPEPYMIPVKRFEQIYEKYKSETLGAKSDDVANILVIDTEATLDDFARYSTFALLTKKHLIAYDDKNKLQVMPLTQVGNLTINHDMAKMVASKMKPFLPMLLPIMIGAITIFMIFFFVTSKLVYLLFGAACLWVSAKLMSYPLTYKKSYQMGLHLVVVTGTLFALLDAWKLNPRYPFLHTSVFVLIGVLILNVLKKLPPTPANVTASKKSK